MQGHGQAACSKSNFFHDQCMAPARAPVRCHGTRGADLAAWRLPVAISKSAMCMHAKHARKTACRGVAKSGVVTFEFSGTLHGRHEIVQESCHVCQSCEGGPNECMRATTSVTTEGTGGDPSRARTACDVHVRGCPRGPPSLGKPPVARAQLQLQPTHTYTLARPLRCASCVSSLPPSLPPSPF